VALPPIVTDTVACETSLLDQRQCPRGRGLVNAKSLGNLGCRQMRGRIEKLQGRVLRGMDAAVGEHVLVEYRRRSGGLPKSCAITGERSQFHGTILHADTCNVKPSPICQGNYVGGNSGS
jgi:hypothetical protein